MHKDPQSGTRLWVWSLELFFNSTWVLVRSWMFCLQNFPCFGLVCGACLAPLGMPKWVWPSMNRYRMFYLQTSTLPPRMHHKLTKHGRFCMQNNQLPTKTHVESKDNSILSKKILSSLFDRCVFHLILYSWVKLLGFALAFPKTLRDL